MKCVAFPSWTIVFHALWITVFKTPSFPKQFAVLHFVRHVGSCNWGKARLFLTKPSMWFFGYITGDSSMPSRLLWKWGWWLSPIYATTCPLIISHYCLIKRTTVLRCPLIFNGNILMFGEEEIWSTVFWGWGKENMNLCGLLNQSQASFPKSVFYII